MSVQARALEWDGCLNARDTGGYPAEEGVTRYGVLFRSDNLCRLTDVGLSGFAASEVKTVLDVRSAYELEIDPSPFAESNTVRYLNLPLLNEDDAEAIAQINSDIPLPDMYRVMLGHFGANIAVIAQAVADADGAIVVHCHAGKDRTGLVIALLLALVGVKNEDIVVDYVVSHDYLHEPRAARIASSAPELRVGLEHRLGAEEATMLSTLDWLKTEYGGAEAYLLKSGVSRTTLAELRERLVARGSL